MSAEPQTKRSDDQTVSAVGVRQEVAVETLHKTRRPGPETAGHLCDQGLQASGLSFSPLLSLIFNCYTLQYR